MEKLTDQLREPVKKGSHKVKIMKSQAVSHKRNQMSKGSSVPQSYFKKWEKERGGDCIHL